MQAIKDIKLLVKTARAKDPSEFSESDLKRLSILLDLDKLFENFSEKALRSYRDECSGQPIFGRQTVRDKDGEIMYFSSIPTQDATRSQLYEGMIFSTINPAVRNLAKILFDFQPSDYAKMTYSKAVAWATLSTVLTNVKAWAKYIDVVISPGVIISPMMGCNDTTNLAMLDYLIFSNSNFDLSIDVDRMYGEFEFV